MHRTLTHHPLTTAIAAGVGARVGGSATFGRLPGMAMRSSPNPIDRGITR